MIIIKASGHLPRIYGDAFVDRRFIFRSFADMMKHFDKVRDDEWYGNSKIVIHDISGASYDDLINNENWLMDCNYFFYTVE